MVNDAHTLNYYGLDISSISIDTHDPTGNTVYVTVAGIESLGQEIQVVYRSTNGGASWTDITANLPAAPANSLAVDPQNANTVYVATDDGRVLHHRGGELRAIAVELLVGVRHRIARRAGGCAQRRSGYRFRAGSGGGHLRPRHLANRVVERRHGNHLRVRKSRFAHLPKPGLRHHQRAR